MAASPKRALGLPKSDLGSITGSGKGSAGPKTRNCCGQFNLQLREAFVNLQDTILGVSWGLGRCLRGIFACRN